MKPIQTGINKARSVGGKAYAYGKNAVKKVKENYGYFKAGRRAEFDEENAMIRKNAMKRLRGESPDVEAFHNTRGKSFWNKATGGRMK